MTFSVRTPDGRILTVHTEVCEGRFADVVIEEEAPQEAPMEGSE